LRYSDENEELDSEGLSQFLFSEQQISKHPDDCLDLIAEFEPSDLKHRVEPKMSAIGKNNAFNMIEYKFKFA